MKTVLTTVLTLATSLMLQANTLEFSTDKEKNKKGDKAAEKSKEVAVQSKNFHSIKKWKMRIEYHNGDVIYKTIEVGESSSKSAMEIAFTEAEKFIKNLGQVKGYEVSPISKNRFVLLATD